MPYRFPTAEPHALEVESNASIVLARGIVGQSQGGFGSAKVAERLTRKKRGTTFVWILAVILATAMVAFGANAARLLVLDAPQASDVILVRAGETDRRPARALQLLDQGYGRRVVIDVSAIGRVYHFSQTQLAEEYVQSLPQRASVRICPIEGLSTREESHDVEKCLGEEDGTRILIVTSDYHTRRSLSIFRREVRGKSFSVAAARDNTQF